MVNPYLQNSRNYPVKLIVDIHSHCNGRCTMCPYPSLAPKQTQGDMSWDLYTTIVDEFAELGRQHGFQPQLTYCYMGEPFLAEDLSAYVSYAIKNNIEVYLNTNAAAMTPTQIDALLACGFDGKFHISIHGITPAVYERIMGLEFAPTLANIHYLLDNYDQSKICIRGVDDGWPNGEKQRWMDYWAAYSVKLEYLPPISRCGSVKRLLPNKIRQSNQTRLYGCRLHHPLVEMVILFDGQAVMCCQDMAREIIWGNVAQHGIAGVWSSPVRKKTVDLLYSGKPISKKFLCARCEQALGPTGLVQSMIQTAWKKLRSPQKITQK